MVSSYNVIKKITQMRLLKEGERKGSKKTKRGVKKGVSINYDRPQTHNRRSNRKVFKIIYKS